jgi:CelD/BcsL family acetyltransferase involved in cellulose biosynthesis
MIEIRRITDWEEASAYQNEWNNLVLNNECTRSTIFQTFEWNQTWWQAFGDVNHQLLLLFAFREGLLVGVAPLMIKRQKYLIPSKVVYWIGASDSSASSDFCSFVTVDDYEKVIDTFIQWFETHTTLWDEIAFKNMTENSNDLFLLKSYFTGRCTVQFMQDAPSRKLNATDDKSKLDSIFPDNLKSNLKSLKKMGTLSYHCWDCAKEINPRLNVLFEQHIARRSKTPHPSFFKNEAHKNYFRMLISTLSPKGWVQLFTTTLDEKTIAHYITFKFQNTLYLYTPAFDIQLMKYSPGVIQISSLFDYALKENLKEVSFGAGGEGYKYRYSNNTLKLYEFHTFNSRRRYALFNTLYIIRKIAHHFLRPFRYTYTKILKG